MLSRSEQQLWQFFGEIGRIDQMGRTVAERALPAGLTLAQFAILDHLVRVGGEWSPVRLARAFQVTKQTMTSTLRRLETQGYVATRADPDDRRGKRVWLTPEGAGAHSVSLARLGPALAVAADGVPDGLIDWLLPRLGDLRTALEKAGE